MVDRITDPVAWALLIYELEDAQDGLRSLLQELADNPEYGEEEFRVDMAHIYMHLNRAWHGRNATASQHDDEVLWNKWTEFPTDLEPLNPSGL